MKKQIVKIFTTHNKSAFSAKGLLSYLTTETHTETLLSNVLLELDNLVQEKTLKELMPASDGTRFFMVN